MKKLFIITVSLIAFGLTGCLKDKFGTDLYSTGGPILEFEYPQGGAGVDIGTGLEYFSGCALPYPPSDLSDTTFVIINLASTNTLGKDISTTVAADNSALLDNFSNDSITYVAMPDSDYTILNPTGTIKAGTRQDTVYIVFYPYKIDPTKNYGLPLTVTNTQGITVSGNFGHVYIHTIGNPLAGLYTVTGFRLNYSGASGWSGPPAAYPTPVSSTDLSAAVGSEVASPDNTTTVELGFSNLGPNGYNLIITYDASGPSISVTGNFLSAVSNFKVWSATITLDPVTGKATINVVMSYNNGASGSGNDRIVYETFVQQ